MEKEIHLISYLLYMCAPHSAIKPVVCLSDFTGQDACAHDQATYNQCMFLQ